MVGDDLGRELDAVGAGHPPEMVDDLALLARLLLDLVAQRPALIATADCFDLGAHGGREQQDLAVIGRLVEDATDGSEKAHVDHPVRLVDHDRANRAQVEIAAGHEVLDAARTTDDDLRAAAKRLALGPVADTAVEGHGPQEPRAPSTTR